MATTTAHGWLLLMGLVALLKGGLSAQGCSQLRSRLQEANRGYLALLNRNLGSTVPSQCIEDALDFSPGEGDLVKIYQLQGENAKVAVHEIFQQVYHLFSQDRTELAWDEPSVRDLLNGLDQEIERLESCLSAGRYTYNIRRTVKRYFQQLSSFLEGKEYATCAWTIVQKRVQHCLGLTDRLIKSIEAQA